jgi:hypothetical protein
LNIDHERQRLAAALGSLEQMGLLKLRWVEGQTVRDLHHALLQREWHIFHFIGHGAFDSHQQEGVLALADEQGKTQLLSATDLARMLTQRPSLRLVVLNSCQGAAGNRHDLFSSTAATLASKRIPAVLAMQYDISDQAAIDFTCGFYNSLAVGLPVDGAVTQARTAISVGTVRTLEWVTPVLYLRAPTGKLFDVPPPVTGRPPAAAQPPRPIESSPLQANIPPVPGVAPGVSPVPPAYTAFSNPPQAGNLPVGSSPAYGPGSLSMPGQGMTISNAPAPPLASSPAYGFNNSPVPGQYSSPSQPVVPFAPPMQPQWTPPQQGAPIPGPTPPGGQKLGGSRRLLLGLVGAVIIIGIILTLVYVGINAATNKPSTPSTNVNASPTATATPSGGQHIANVEIGKGDDKGNITTKTNLFSRDDTIVITYVATTQDSNAQVALRIVDSSGSSLQGGPSPYTLERGTHTYYFAIKITGADNYTAQLQYNGATEETFIFTVS